MRKLIGYVMAATLLLLSSQSIATEYSGTFTRRVQTPILEVGYEKYKASADITIRVNWKLWTLLGEPVIDSRAQWKIHSVTIEGAKENRINGIYYPGISDHIVSKEAFQSIDIIASKVKLQSVSYTQYAQRVPTGLIVDLGVMAKPGIEKFGSGSFNVPASPNWDELFTKGFIGNVTDAPQYFGTQKSRTMFSSKKLDFGDATCPSGATYAPECFFYQFSANFSGFIQAIVAKQQKSELAKVKKLNKSDSKAQKDAILAETEDDIFAEFEVEMQQERSVKQLNKNAKKIDRTYQRKLKKLKDLDKKNIAKKAKKYKEVASRTLPGDKLETFSRKVNGDWLYGYKNSKNKTVIAPQFKVAENFHEGLAVVKSETGWGYINTKGKLVIKLMKRVWQIGAFSNGRALIKTDYESLEYEVCEIDRFRYKYYYINKQGEIVTDILTQEENRPTFCLRSEKA